MSAIGINGTYFQLYIDKKEVPLDELTFSEVLISSHILYKLPIGHIRFTDAKGVMDKFPLEDGTKINFKLGASTKRVFLYEYRVYNVTKEKVGKDQTAYTISFIDIVDVWRLQPSKTSLKGTSSQVLEKVAKYCGLTYEGVTTTDTQVWLPMAETFCDFAHRIRKSGYVDGSSCMLMAVNMYGHLKYANLSAIPIDKAKVFRYGSDEYGAIPVMDIAFHQDSGSSNEDGGYKQTNHQFSAKKQQRQKSSKVETRRLSESTNVNKEVSGKVGDGRIKHLPVDAGNNHDNTLRARNQNNRVPMLLSSRVSILTILDPELELLEPCILQVYDGNAKMKDKESGIYLVAGKTIVMNADMRYMERYELIRDGSNNLGGKTV